MTELSVAHRAALARLIENVPDRTLTALALAVRSMPGEKARALSEMLAAETLDRTRRARGLAALTPLFRPRPDEVEGVVFPAGVLPRLWKIASAREEAILPHIDPLNAYDDDPHRISTVCARLFAACASAVRDQPDLVWPPAGSDAAAREAGLKALAQACDLGGLAHRALPSLHAWIGRPDANQLAELRLVIRDASVISDDGARELIDILFAHLPDAALVLRLIGHASGAAGREDFLAGSELAVFVERLVAATERRAARAADASASLETLHGDLAWLAQVLSEMAVTPQIAPDSAWGQRLKAVRTRVAGTIDRRLARVTKTVEACLPMGRAQTAGRMTREVPNLELPIDPQAVEAAQAALDLVRALRGPAPDLGCEAPRAALVQALAERIGTYADLAIEEINAGAVADEPLAVARVGLAVDFLQRIEDAARARAVRRRVAVARSTVTKVSPKAA